MRYTEPPGLAIKAYFITSIASQPVKLGQRTFVQIDISDPSRGPWRVGNGQRENTKVSDR